MSLSIVIQTASKFQVYFSHCFNESRSSVPKRKTWNQNNCFIEHLSDFERSIFGETLNQTIECEWIVKLTQPSSISSCIIIILKLDFNTCICTPSILGIHFSIIFFCLDGVQAMYKLEQQELHLVWPTLRECILVKWRDVKKKAQKTNRLIFIVSQSFLMLRSLHSFAIIIYLD